MGAAYKRFFSVPQIHGEMKGKSPGAAYNRVRLINGILRYLDIKDRLLWFVALLR